MGFSHCFSGPQSLVLASMKLVDVFYTKADVQGREHQSLNALNFS